MPDVEIDDCDKTLCADYDNKFYGPQEKCHGLPLWHDTRTAENHLLI